MSPEMQALDAMLSCVTARGSQHDHVNIEEPNPGATLRRVVLTGLPDDALAFDPDRGRGNPALMSPLFAMLQGSSHNKACDTVVVRRKGGETSTLFIDLKSGSTGGSVGQFKSTRCFVRYLLDLSKTLNGYDWMPTSERFVVFFTPKSGKRTLAKQPTHLKGIRGGYSPDSPKKIPVSSGQKVPLGLLLT